MMVYLLLGSHLHNLPFTGRIGMKHCRMVMTVLALFMALAFVAPQNASASVASAPPPVGPSQSDCPKGVTCKLVPAAINDQGCTYSPTVVRHDIARRGVTMHFTEGTLAQALAEAQDPNICISWNYLIDQRGVVYVAVQPNAYAYDAGNWYINTGLIQIEQVGFGENCSTLSRRQFRSAVRLVRYLMARYGFQANPSTILGHVNVPAVDDRHMAAMHWDPGTCWDWQRFLRDLGDPIRATSNANKASVVTIASRNRSNDQAVYDCPGINFTSCTPAKQNEANFVQLRTAPSLDAPLLSNPYLHPDGSAGTPAMQDWGDQARFGLSYVVAERRPGWTAIWYGGQEAWFQDDGRVLAPARAATVSSKGNTPVTVYGQPMPEDTAPGWSNIPSDLWPNRSATLSKYSLLPGQHYVVAQVAAPDTYNEGCDNSTCTYPGDTTVVVGKTRYLEIYYNDRFAFVKASDVTITPAR